MIVFQVFDFKPARRTIHARKHSRNSEGLSFV
jgi:hypothetical protein